MPRTFSFSDQGPRSANQDSFCVDQLDRGLLLGVADGVGGNNGGEIASRFAIETLLIGARSGLSISTCADNAHEGLLAMGNESPELYGMATTLTAIVYEENNLSGVHCGDSRAYILRGQGIKQLTTDHTEVARLLAEGRISRDDYVHYPRKNVLTSALGSHKEFIKQTFEFECKSGDRLLLITDGIYSVLSKKEIQFYSTINTDFTAFCDCIISEVGEREPTDNFTLVGVEFD
ncbi:PP2C family protein-serine/threonine phosphatase [Burkholderia cenocepacia]|uniref:PP2C family protein-serine/threonine phosphatase n=1 Tax=Burkholderia cenocepacia TaxID=95486 RepID=UPI002AB6F4CF|nr:protein phosphatase 2C domain-containing protein [Burkholderia cenocepacia]